MMDKEKENFFIEFKDLLADYLQNRLGLLRLSAYEKIARIIALLFSGIVLTILFFFGILFISLMCGLYLNSILHSPFLGFGIVGGLYLGCFLLVLKYRKALIEKLIMNAVISILFDDEEDKEK
jgi:hypothetical protein